MKIPLSALKKFLPIKLSPLEIGDILTNLGLEVDGIITIKPSFQNVVVAKITDVKPHPNADLLFVVKAYDGKKTFEIVCGAPNCKKGMLAALAKVGASLQDDHQKTYHIKQTKIRGVVSLGMLCSEKELGISEEHEGIAELTDLKLGTDLENFFSDTVFDISLTPNLAHCHSVLGVARELSAKLKIKLREDLIDFKPSKTAQKKIDIQSKNCSRYSYAIFKNVSVKPSPLTVVKTLLAFDQKPINNIVDMTNLLMLEYGLPMHAFDLDKLEGKSIIIKQAKEKQTLTTLDGKKRTLTKEDLVICDEKKSIALAGIMGAKNSEVTTQTKNIFLEAAIFDPISVRKSAKRHIKTEASLRFEKGCDPLQVPKSIQAFIDLFGPTSCAQNSSFKYVPKQLSLRTKRTKELLGVDITPYEMKTSLERLFCQVKQKKDLLKVVVPSFRQDLNEEIDLVEEIIRLFGLNQLKLDLKPSYFSTFPNPELFTFENEVRLFLFRQNLQEFLTCNLISETHLNLFEGLIEKKEWVKIKDASCQTLSVLRPTLLKGLLECAEKNFNKQSKQLNVFEIGKVHLKENAQFVEPLQLGILLTGHRTLEHFSTKSEPFDFFDLKAIIEALLTHLNCQHITFKPSDYPLFHPHQQAVLMFENLHLGALGMLHPQVAKLFDLSQPVFLAEINLNDLLTLKKKRTILPLPKFPSTQRDWTLSLKDTFHYADFKNALTTLNSNLLKNVQLLDIYSGEHVTKGMQNFTFRFTYAHDKKTLCFESCEKEHNRILQHLTKALANFI